MKASIWGPAICAALACLGAGLVLPSAAGSPSKGEGLDALLHMGMAPPPWSATCEGLSGWARVLERYMGHWDVVTLVAWPAASGWDGGPTVRGGRTAAVVRALALCAAPLALYTYVCRARPCLCRSFCFLGNSHSHHPSMDDKHGWRGRQLSQFYCPCVCEGLAHSFSAIRGSRPPKANHCCVEVTRLLTSVLL